MARKSFHEIHKYINDSIVSLIKRNDTFTPWLESKEHQFDITIQYSHLPHYQQIGPTCGLTALLMIKDYYNKLQESEILNLIDNEEKQNIYNDNNNNNQKDFNKKLSDILKLAIKKNFTNKGEMFWSKGMALLVRNYCGLKCKILKFHSNDNEKSTILINDQNDNFSKNNISIMKNEVKSLNSILREDSHINEENDVNNKINISLMDYNQNRKNSRIRQYTVNPFYKITQTITRNLLNNNLCLIPYDKDGNNEPCFKKGHKAHWCIINGFIIIEPKKNKNKNTEYEYTENSKFNIIWNDKESSNEAIDHLDDQLSNIYFICTHSSSRYPGLFKGENLLKSNAQLIEVAPSVIKETRETIYQDLMKEFNSKLKNLNISSDGKATTMNKISINDVTIKPSIIPPPPPPSLLSKNENNFTNNVKNAFLNQFYSSSNLINSNINKNINNEKMKLNECQKTQLNRHGYIIPNFYSLPKKNIYQWEHYKANLRKNLLSNINIKMNINNEMDYINNKFYQGHSIKETLSSSIILVGKNNIYIQNSSSN